MVLQDPQTLEELQKLAKRAQAVNNELAETKTMILKKVQELRRQIIGLSLAKLELKGDIEMAVDAMTAGPGQQSQ